MVVTLCNRPRACVQKGLQQRRGHIRKLLDSPLEQILVEQSQGSLFGIKSLAQGAMVPEKLLEKASD